MIIVADPDAVIVPMIWAMTGVNGLKVNTTRVDTAFPTAPLFVVHGVPDVQDPVGALPTGSQLI